MMKNTLLEDLWAGRLLALDVSAESRVAAILRSFVPVEITFLAARDPDCRIAVHMDCDEIEDGLTFGDAVAEETGAMPAMGSIIVVAPLAMLAARDRLALSRGVGRIAAEMMLMATREAGVPLELENAMLFHLAAMGREAACGARARKAGLCADTFAGAMGAVLADFWGNPRFAAVVGIPAGAHSDFALYMRNLDPGFDAGTRVRWSSAVVGTAGRMPLTRWLDHMALDLCARREPAADPAPVHV